MADRPVANPTIGRRRLPGTGLDLSELGWELPRRGGPLGGLVEKAVRSGITLVDVGPFAPAAVQLGGWPLELRRQLTVIGSLGDGEGQAGPVLRPAEAATMVERLGFAAALLVFDESEVPGPGSGPALELDDWSGPTSNRLWGVRASPDASDVGPLRRAAELGARFFTVRASLLEGAALGRVQRAAADRVGILVNDPFASGRLDGSVLRGHPLVRGPPTPPVPLERLQEEYAPLLRLGYLTDGRRRTLAEAALLALRKARGVCSVLVPADDPASLAERAPGRPAAELTTAELARIAQEWPVELSVSEGPSI